MFGFEQASPVVSWSVVAFLHAPFPVLFYLVNGRVEGWGIAEMRGSLVHLVQFLWGRSSPLMRDPPGPIGISRLPNEFFSVYKFLSKALRYWILQSLSGNQRDRTCGEIRQACSLVTSNGKGQSGRKYQHERKESDEVSIQGKIETATRVLSCGDAGSGALGHTESYGGDAYEPREVDGIPSNIVGVGAGHYHSLAVTQSGELWAWGRNAEGQLGPRVKDSRETWHRPQKVKGLESVQVKVAAASGVVSMAIATDGSLWAWGKSKRGQLGLGPGITEAEVPRRVGALAGEQVVQVALGWGHALACTTKGHLYSWGYAADGRLGFWPEISPRERAVVETVTPKSEMGKTLSMQELAEKQVHEDMEREKMPVLQWEPSPVGFLSGQFITEIACGFDHSLALTDCGQIFSFGDNSLGQLGRKMAKAPTQPTNLTSENPVHCVDGRLAISRIVHIGAGLGHSLAIDSEGAIFSWGWNAGCQLGREGNMDTSSPGEIKDLQGKGVVAVAGGRVHSLAFTSKGEIWVWGSGKNGRLGLGGPSDEPFPFLLKALGMSLWCKLLVDLIIHLFL